MRPNNIAKPCYDCKKCQQGAYKEKYAMSFFWFFMNAALFYTVFWGVSWGYELLVLRYAPFTIFKCVIGFMFFVRFCNHVFTNFDWDKLFE
jgi:hypothetical protein